jgi:hypothetical protein
MPFQPGQSGNPAGRPRGARNKTTVLLERLLEGASDAPGAIAAIITAVCAGEITPTEGTSLTRMVEAYVRAKQRTDEVGYRPEREKAADLAASPQPAKVPVSRKIRRL